MDNSKINRPITISLHNAACKKGLQNIVIFMHQFMVQKCVEFFFGGEEVGEGLGMIDCVSTSMLYITSRRKLIVLVICRKRSTGFVVQV